MNDRITLAEALEDPEALPTVQDSLTTIFAAIEDMYNDLNIDLGAPMELADPARRKTVRNYLDTITNALDDLEQWGDEIIDHAEQNM